jgi:hypothetical protein
MDTTKWKDDDDGDREEQREIIYNEDGTMEGFHEVVSGGRGGCPDVPPKPLVERRGGRGGKEDSSHVVVG